MKTEKLGTKEIGMLGLAVVHTTCMIMSESSLLIGNFLKHHRSPL